MLILSLCIGGLLGLGLVMIVAGFPLGWKPSLSARVESQLRGHVPTSKLIQRPPRTPLGDVGRLARPVLEAVVEHLERYNLGNDVLERRLRTGGVSASVVDYRVQQLVMLVLGACVGIVGSVAIALRGSLHPLLGVLLVVGCAALGFALRDNILSMQIKARQRRIVSEFPTIADVIALSVSAGDSMLGALQRVAHLTRGDLATELNRTLQDIHAGAGLTSALRACAARVQIPAVERFVEGIIVALERGTPLAEVMRAQAKDVRELSRRELMESAGKKEIGMMAPVVFGLLPLTVVFAVFPGLSLLNINV